jgi:hypothetical protein
MMFDLGITVAHENEVIYCTPVFPQESQTSAPVDSKLYDFLLLQYLEFFHPMDILFYTSAESSFFHRCLQVRSLGADNSLAETR